MRGQCTECLTGLGPGRRWWCMVLLVLACSLEPPAMQRAVLLAERGRVEQAISLLTDHVARHPRAIGERRLLIRLHGTAGRLDRARAQTERLAEFMPPGDPTPWLELGHACELAHQYDEALTAYDRAAVVAPRDPLGVKQGGLRAARWGELALAEPRLEEAVRRAPGDAEAWHALGLVRMGLGRLEAARQAYAAGLAADPEALENRLGLATVALKLDEPRAALHEYELLLEARPEFADALLGKSWSLILIGELGDAAAVLLEAEARGADRDTIARQRRALEERRRKLP